PAGPRSEGSRGAGSGLATADDLSVERARESHCLALRRELQPEAAVVKSEQAWRYLVIVEPASHPGHWPGHVAGIAANFDNVHRAPRMCFGGLNAARLRACRWAGSGRF